MSIKLNEFIKHEINKQRKTIRLVAREINASYWTLYNKLEMDNLTGYDILNLSRVLEFNINDIKDKI